VRSWLSGMLKEQFHELDHVDHRACGGLIDELRLLLQLLEKRLEHAGVMRNPRASRDRRIARQGMDFAKQIDQQRQLHGGSLILNEGIGRIADRRELARSAADKELANLRLKLRIRFRRSRRQALLHRGRRGYA